MTEKEYRQHPAISRSELWRMHESPEKFKYYRDNPPEPTSALLFGQVVHKLLLQPEDFVSEFVIAPEVDRRTKHGKAAWNDFVTASVGRSVVTPDMYYTALEMAEKARNTPYVAKLLSGEREKPFFWTDEDTGEQCKVRCDVLTDMDGTLTVVDYKTSASAKSDIFNNSIFKYGYHFQAGMYTEGVMKALGLTERPAFTFVVQEKYPPYALNYVTVPEDVMLSGVDTFREYIGTYHECKETGYWYGYNGPFDEPNEAYLPGWMQMGVDQNETDE